MSPNIWLPVQVDSAEHDTSELKNASCHACVETDARSHSLYIFAEELRSTFLAFASFGSRTEITEIDNARFFKLIKECGLTSSSVSDSKIQQHALRCSSRCVYCETT
jgi:hypothetical protein